MSIPSHQTVIFFDAYCGFCDRVVALLLPYAKESRFLFAPLGGKTFGALKVRYPALTGIDSVVLIENFGDLSNERALVKGHAVLSILNRLPSAWRLLRVLILFMPAMMRDFLYDCVARNRWRLAGRRESCRVPAPADLDLFLP